MLLFNAGTEAVDFTLPTLSSARVWACTADTSRPSPDDIYPLRYPRPLDQQGHYTVDFKSSVVLIAMP